MSLNPNIAAPFHIDATTPLLGAQVTIDPEFAQTPITLRVNNDGGRGAPWGWLVIPVTCVDPERMQPALALDTMCGPTAQALWRAPHPPSPTDAGPYMARYSIADWTAIGEPNLPRLVVLLYQLSDLTAEPGAARAACRPPAGCPPAAYELQRVRALFDPPTRNPEVLRRGVVWLDPRDLPGSRHARARTTFVLASCQYPAGMLDDTPRELGVGPGGPADASMRRLAAALDPACEASRPSLVLLVGDQIYADATAGLFDPRAVPVPGASEPPDSVEMLRVSYENWLANSTLALGLTQTRMTLDDHEIEDNWQPLAPSAGKTACRINDVSRDVGVAGYERFQRGLPGEPPFAPRWQVCDHRGLKFFLADTRSERCARKASIDPLQPSIMSATQEDALAQWLPQASAAGPCFVSSPAMLLPRRRSSVAAPRAAIHSDAWDGYPGSLHRLLALLCRHRISNAVFLSGDEHLSSITRATVTDLATGLSIVLHSIHSSGLYAPFPFANSLAEDFATPDDWEFTDPVQHGSYRCQVEVLRWAPGDGYACVSVTPPNRLGGGWRLKVRFGREAGGPAVAPWHTTLFRPAPTPRGASWPRATPAPAAHPAPAYGSRGALLHRPGGSSPARYHR